MATKSENHKTAGEQLPKLERDNFKTNKIWLLFAVGIQLIGLIIFKCGISLKYSFIYLLIYPITFVEDLLCARRREFRNNSTQSALSYSSKRDRLNICRLITVCARFCANTADRELKKTQKSLLPSLISVS